MSEEQKNTKNEKITTELDNEYSLLGENLSFDGIEAFNLLRTNLMLSFPDAKKCHKIGITSPIPGTGKSLISINLAYSISKTDKSVLLIDGDLRLPSVARKIGIKAKFGLSNYLVGGCEIEDAIQHIGKKLDVITAGDIPPKPSELLGSPKMQELLEELSDKYDFIIVDTTPVTVVPDALVIAHYLDGIVLVVRKEHDEKNALKDTLRQMDLAKTKILGMVFNYGKSTKGSYGKYYKYGNKYYKSGYKYGYGHYSSSRYGMNPTMKETKDTKETKENLNNK